MKKNRFVKLASGLLVLCLLTTCVIGATLAKYTTAGSGADTARVAKWGVTISASGSLFGKAYASNSAGANANEIVASSTNVLSSNTQNVVAPGTKNTTGLNFTVSGTPEVAYSLTVASNTAKDIYLKAGTYGYMVAVTLKNGDDLEGLYLKSDDTSYTKQTTGTYSSGDYYKLVEVATASADYYPISWSMGGNTYTSLSNPSTGLVKALIALSQPTVNAGVNVAINKTITWAWEFHVSDNNDKLDTLLGDLMANNVYTSDKALVVSTDSGTTYKAAVEVENYNLNVNLDITITATQID